MPNSCTSRVSLVCVALFLVALAGCGRKRPTSIAPATPTMIHRSLTELLSATPQGELGGFIIFHGPTSSDFIQYALDPAGLRLDWPAVQAAYAARLPTFLEVLAEQGFTDHCANRRDPPDILALTPKQFCITPDGISAQCGRDVDFVAALTADLLSRVLSVPDPNAVHVTLEPQG